MKEIKKSERVIIMEMEHNDTITVKELYEWAVKHGAENYAIWSQPWNTSYEIDKVTKDIFIERDPNWE